MNSSKFLSSLGLARRANKIFYGFDSVCENANKINLVILASDISTRTAKNIYNLTDIKKIETIEVKHQKDTLGYAIGAKPVGIIGITDNGFAKILKDRIKEETE